MDRLLNGQTTLSKGLKTLLWVGVSAAVVAVLSTVTQRPELFNPTLVAVANVLLVLVKNLLDNNVKNY